MAKKRKQTDVTPSYTDDGTTLAPSPITDKMARTSEKLIDFAEDLGRLLGTATARAATWMDQRQVVLKQLHDIRTTADELLGRLTGGTAAAAKRGRARSAAKEPVARKGSGKRKRTISPEAKEKMRQAALKRWARIRQDKKK